MAPFIMHKDRRVENWRGCERREEERGEGVRGGERRGGEERREGERTGEERRTKGKEKKGRGDGIYCSWSYLRRTLYYWSLPPSAGPTASI